MRTSTSTCVHKKIIYCSQENNLLLARKWFIALSRRNNNNEQFHRIWNIRISAWKILKLVMLRCIDYYFTIDLENKILLQITSSIIYFLYRIQYNILQIGHGILQNCVNEYSNNLRNKIFGQNYEYDLLHNIELHLCWRRFRISYSNTHKINP